MIRKQNLHTHTAFCDGSHMPEEVIAFAKKQGFDSIGFSGHSPMSYSVTYGMTPEAEQEYIKEVRRVQKEYADDMKIFCGIEYDMYSGTDISEYDYAIGAVHYLKIGEEYVGFDRSAEEVKRVIDIYFGGDGMAYVKKYYETMAQLPKYGKFDILGHFDLITKHTENIKFFDENSKEYLSCAIEVAETLVKEIPLFEVNTGAIARGYRTTPYPSIPLLKELKRLGYGVVIGTDCHNAAQIGCGYELACKLLTDCGFKYKYILTENGFVPIPL